MIAEQDGDGQQATIEGGSASHDGSTDQCKTVAVIPAYNEARFIGSVVLTTRQHADRVIVVDDGSRDDTGALARAAGALVVEHDSNQGKGVALNSGFRRALELEPDAVITIDADGQHIPQQLKAVAQPVLEEEADIVVGSRYLRDARHVPLLRILGHRIFNFLIRAASGVAVSDSQSGFRAFSRRALRAISFKSEGFSVESEMQFIANEHDLSIVEIPVTIYYHDRPKRPMLTHGLQVLNGLLQMVGQYRPLRFFGLPGTLMLLAGLAWGIYVLDVFHRTQELAVGYALICVLLVIAGNIALTTGIILHSMRSMFLQFLSGSRRPAGGRGDGFRS